MLIAVLEDDAVQLQQITKWLIDEEHQVVLAADLKTFNAECMTQPLDMAIIDWQLPDGTGIEALTRMKSEMGKSVGVIFVTQRDSEEDAVEALNSGADDYIVKPVKQYELLARMNAVSRRSGLGMQSNTIELGPIVIDKSSRRVSFDGELVKLTNKDYHLACCILSNPGKLLSREFLLRTVWGLSGDINTRTVDVHISRIRRALNIGPEIGYSLINVYQHGYRLEKLPDNI